MIRPASEWWRVPTIPLSPESTATTNCHVWSRIDRAIIARVDSYQFISIESPCLISMCRGRMEIELYHSCGCKWITNSSRTECGHPTIYLECGKLLRNICWCDPMIQCTVHGKFRQKSPEMVVTGESRSSIRSCLILSVEYLAICHSTCYTPHTWMTPKSDYEI